MERTDSTDLDGIIQYETKIAKQINGIGTPDDGENAYRRIIVPTDDQLAAKPAYRRAAIVVNELDLSRRKTVVWVGDQLYDFLAIAEKWREDDIAAADRRGQPREVVKPRGEFVWAAGDRYKLPCVASVFGDESCAWIGDLKRFAFVESRQRPQARIIERLRLIYLAIEVWNPVIARHILR